MDACTLRANLFALRFERKESATPSQLKSHGVVVLLLELAFVAARAGWAFLLRLLLLLERVLPLVGVA